ncbi:hypothetical protein [Rhizobium jaguaris]|uniref:hypothetical protein n=1 Tax=Rhizobium jaguaris TaxID=1312183 RepID=UPI0026AE5F2D
MRSPLLELRDGMSTFLERLSFPSASARDLTTLWPVLAAMLASLALTLHVGVLADCPFDPGTAVCLKQATSGDNKMPLT